MNLLATQIPECAETEAENVQIWIQRIEKVVEIRSLARCYVFSGDWQANRPQEDSSSLEQVLCWNPGKVFGKLS